jgi:hypothetical protein
MFIFSSIFSTFSNEGEILTLSGKFISKKGHSMAKKYGTDYFFQINDEKGKTYAYPITVKDKNMAKMIRDNRSKVFTIVAVPTSKKVQVGEVSKYVHVLDIKQAQVFSMKSLGLQESDMQVPQSAHPYYDRSKERQASPTFNISDKAANSIIFAAGAALLGSILIK